MKVVFRPAARRDVILQVGYYIDRNAEHAAERFPLAVEEAVHQITRQPDMGPLQHFKGSRWTGLRSWPVPGFEELRIYYLRPQPALIRILRIVHGRRDLGLLFD